MIYLYITLLIILSALFKSQQDTIAFNPSKAWFSFNWWISKDYKFNFWLKIPLSFLENGWHLCDAVRTFSLLLIIALLIGYWWLSLIMYAVYGLIFESLYKK